MKKKEPKIVIKKKRNVTAKEVNTSDNVLTTIAKSKHAKFGSPSGLYALEKCPGKIAFGKDLPELPISEYALEGTVFHEIMDKAFPLYLDDNLKEIEKLLQDVEYDDMPEYVWLTLEEVRKKWEKFKSKHEHATYYLELKVQINEDIYGTADVVFTGINKKTGKINVVVTDYKYGKGVPVLADENLQGIAYLIGALKTLKIDTASLDQAIVIIAQVRLDGGWSQFVVKGKELTTWEEKISSIVQVAKDTYEGKLPIKLSAGSHCRFCKCAPVCPEQKKEHYDLVVQDAGELPIEEAVKKLTLDEQVNLFLKKAYVEDFLDAVTKNLKNALETGISHPAIKLIKTSGRRGWKKDTQTIAEELIKIGCKDPFSRKLRGITEIEKELGKNTINDFVELSQGKIEVVRAEDKRIGIDIHEIKELPE